MAVVDTASSDVFGDVSNTETSQRGAPDYTKSRGNIYRTAGRIDNAATDSDTSRYKIAELPSTCILLPESTIDLQNLGYAAATLGHEDDEDSLVPSVTVGTEAAPRAPIAHGDAKWNRPLWEQLGMTEDPGGKIALYIHTAAAANRTRTRSRYRSS